MNERRENSSTAASSSSSNTSEKHNTKGWTDEAGAINQQPATFHFPFSGDDALITTYDAMRPVLLGDAV